MVGGADVVGVGIVVEAVVEGSCCWCRSGMTEVVGVVVVEGVVLGAVAGRSSGLVCSGRLHFPALA